MGTLLAMLIRRTQAAKINGRLLVVILAVFEAGVGQAATAVAVAVAVAAKSGPSAVLIGAVKKPAPAPALPSGAVATRRNARSSASSAGIAASTAVARTQSRHVTTLSLVTSNSLRAGQLSRVSGNIVGHQVAVASAIGGPAKYDAKLGAVIGGTVMGRKR
jgi:hypothetical protein